ncbi:hypothetical protein [Rhodoblastus sp.]|uniref:hypothetical protein n=1 Tax=Rhodoblastus sp. TaxID=1962975 RepID=UPI003F9487C5
MLHLDMNSFREATSQSRKAMNAQRRKTARTFNSGLAEAARVVGLDQVAMSYPALVGALAMAAEEAGLNADALARLEGKGATLLASLVAQGKPAGAEDVVVILPTPASETLDAALTELGLTCNTDKRRKAPFNQIWEGKAIAAELAVLVEPAAGVVNAVRTPKPERSTAQTAEAAEAAEEMTKAPAGAAAECESPPNPDNLRPTKAEGASVAAVSNGPNFAKASSPMSDGGRPNDGSRAVQMHAPAENGISSILGQRTGAEATKAPAQSAAFSTRVSAPNVVSGNVRAPTTAVEAKSHVAPGAELRGALVSPTKENGNAGA